MLLALRLRQSRAAPLVYRLQRLAMTAASSPKVGEKRELSPPEKQIVEKKARSQSPEHRAEAQHVTIPGTSTKPRARNQKQKKGEKKRMRKLLNIEPCSHDDVHWHEVCEMLGQDTIDMATEDEALFESPFEFKEEVELHISRLSSNGVLALLKLHFSCLFPLQEKDSLFRPHLGSPGSS